ncbi:hypothetical protein GQX74_011031 [Glossina fuscipes]|nr:hypothetical protein GQX74_011031 [Glossina fuscipes]
MTRSIWRQRSRKQSTFKAAKFLNNFIKFWRSSVSTTRTLIGECEINCNGVLIKITAVPGSTTLFCYFPHKNSSDSPADKSVVVNDDVNVVLCSVKKQNIFPSETYAWLSASRVLKPNLKTVIKAKKNADGNR